MKKKTSISSISASIEEMAMPQVYLDNAAVAQVRPEVLEAMLPYFRDRFTNPSWGRDEPYC